MKEHRYDHQVEPIAQPAHQPRQPTNLAIRLQAATAIAIAIWIVTFLLGLIVTSFLHTWPTWTDAKNSAAIALIVALFTGAGLAIWWSFETVNRQWRLEDKARTRAWQLEDEDRNWTMDDAEDQADDTRDKALNLDRVPIVAWEMLSRYVQSQSTTRDDMIAAGTCTQLEWNKTNQAMRALGLKTRRKWKALPDMMHLWHEWGSRIQIHSGRVWVLDETGANPTPLP